MEGLGEDESLVFSINENENNQEYLLLITDEKIIDDVFAVYDDLVKEEN